jgi:hypothetical protein
MPTLIDSSVLIASERGQLNFDEIAIDTRKKRTLPYLQ